MNTKHLLRKLPAWVLGASLCMGTASVYAFHLDNYEMEGDTTDTSAGLKDGDATGTYDADTIFHEECNAGTVVVPENNPDSPYADGQECGTGAGADGFRDNDIDKDSDTLAFEQKFIDDEFEPDITHHEPSNKDEAPIGGMAGGKQSAVSSDTWGCVQKPNVNNKNDLLQGFIAFEETTEGGVNVYAGAARDKNEGNENFGVWLLKDRNVDCDPAAAPADDPTNVGGFTGVHLDGDRLLVAEFTNGGSVGTVKTFIWNDPDGIPENGDETLDPLGPASTFCSQVSDPGHVISNGADVAVNTCGEVNGTSNIQPAWEPEITGCGKGQTAACGLLEPNMWGEIAAELLQPGENECFAKVMIETRTSQSITANLFDYMISNVDICGDVTIVKETIGESAETFQYTTSLPGTPSGDTGTASVGADFAITTSAPSLATASVVTPLINVDGLGSVIFSDVPPGTYSIAEIDPQSDPGTFAFNKLICVDTVTGDSVPQTATATLSGTINLQVRESVTCYYQNVQPKLTISKDVVSCNQNAENNDPALWDLSYLLDGDTLDTVFLANAAEGDKSSEMFVPVGTHNARESRVDGSGSGSYLLFYDTATDCDASGDVTVTAGDATGSAKNCELINVRQPELTVTKVKVGGDGGDEFDLTIDQIPVDNAGAPASVDYVSGDGTDIGNGGTVTVLMKDVLLSGGLPTRNFATIDVGEVIDAANQNSYSTTISCDDVSATNATFAAGYLGAREVSLDIDAGEVVNCFITNVAVQTAGACPVNPD